MNEYKNLEPSAPTAVEVAVNPVDGTGGSDTQVLKRTSATRSLWDWVRNIASWAALFVTIAVLAAVIVVPRIGGGEVFTVTTGSMSPAYPPGTLIVTKRPDPQSIGVGTVLTYQLQSGRPAVVTHRVVEVVTDTRWRTSYRTQGDANRAVDVDPVRAEQVRGTLWYAVPYLGYVNSALSGGQRTVLFWGVFGALVLYAAFMFLSAHRDARTRRASGTTDRAESAVQPVTRQQ